MQLRPVAADTAPAAELIAAMVDEIGRLYGGSLEDGRGPSAGPAELAPPHGTCLVGFAEDGRAVCVGAVKRLDGGVAEIKRMYVVPEARGAGVARRLLAALEDAARGLGYERVRLDTGPAQPHARSLYERSGYAPIADYNGNPYAAWWGEKRL